MPGLLKWQLSHIGLFVSDMGQDAISHAAPRLQGDGCGRVAVGGPASRS
jgi:hypothetical protein